MAQLVNSLIGLTAAICVGGVLAVNSLDRATGGATESKPRVAVARQSPAEAAPSPSGGGVTLDAGPGGHFHADVEVNGRAVPMLVDTGATIIALTERDAREIGINPSPSDYVIPLQTANGVSRGAAVMLREVRIRNIVVFNVEAVVLPRGASGRSLLGMSFLKRLRSFEIAAGRLVLRD